MKHLKKLNFVVLPLAIWVITVVYVLLNKFIGTFTQNMEPSPVILTILVLIFNLGLQLLIICASTIYAVKKFDLTLKRVVVSLPILYLLFGLFSPPSIYLFVFTDKWSFFSAQYPAMPSLKASIFITLQYGIVMLITTLIACSICDIKTDKDKTYSIRYYSYLINVEEPDYQGLSELSIECEDGQIFVLGNYETGHNL